MASEIYKKGEADFVKKINQAIAENNTTAIMSLLSVRIGQYAAHHKQELIGAVRRAGIDVQPSIADKALFNVIANNIFKGNKQLIKSIVYQITGVEQLNDTGNTHTGSSLSDIELGGGSSNNSGINSNVQIPDSNTSAFDADKFNKITTAVGSAAAGILGQVFGYLEKNKQNKDALAAQNRADEINSALTMQQGSLQAQIQADLEREKAKERTTQIIVVGGIVFLAVVTAAVVIVKLKKSGEASK